MSSTDARRVARLSDLHIRVESQPSEQGPWGRVLSQHPEPGSPIWAGDAISVVVCTKSLVTVPDVRGGEENEMVAELRRLGLAPERRAVRRSDSVPQGHIIRTRPRPGTEVEVGTHVSYVVAGGSKASGKRSRREAHRLRVGRQPDGGFMVYPDDD